MSRLILKPATPRRLNPKNVQVRYLLALIAEQQADPGAMFGNLIIAVDEDPFFVDARLKLGQLYFLGRAYEEAAAQVDVLMDLAPENADVRVLNGRLAFQLGDRAASDTEIDRALEIDPGHIDAIMIKAARHCRKRPGSGARNARAPCRDR